MRAIVSNVQRSSNGIAVITLRSASGAPLPHYEAGAHIDVHLPGGITRQYSLCGLDNRAGEYRIAVKLDPNSRGGSRAIHRLNAGDELVISEPRNTFELVDGAGSYVLVAAGVGLAPLFAMARTLKEKDARFILVYFARDEDDTALLEDLKTHHEDTSVLVIGRDRRDLQPVVYRKILRSSPPDTAFYVCGPAGFMDTARATAREFLPDEQIHSEVFTADREALASGTTAPFVVEFEGQLYEIPADRSVMEVFDAEDIPVLSSCEEGTCGTCAMRVVDGEPDHRDSVFSPKQHADGYFATCVSRAVSPTLSLERMRRAR